MEPVFVVGEQHHSMELRFKDRMGETGVVDESFEVAYSGFWEREVRDVVKVVREGPTEDTLFDPDKPLSYLVLKLPEVVPITEIGLDDLF